MVYVLFSKAGIIGGGGTGGEPPKPNKVRGPVQAAKRPTGVLDAELAD
jgi:hypothetical protein